MEDRHLRNRMGGRTIGEFGHDLHVGCTREQAWAEVWKAEIRARGGKNCDYKDHGVDNTGAVIKGRLANGNADYAFSDILELPMPTEIKHNWPRCEFQTFKAQNLKSYVRQGDFMLVPTEYGYHVLGKTAMQEILRVCRPRRLMDDKDCRRAGIGTDPRSVAAQVKGGVKGEEIGLISRLVEQGHILHRKWTPEARKVMEPLLPTLRERTSGKGITR